MRQKEGDREGEEEGVSASLHLEMNQKMISMTYTASEDNTSAITSNALRECGRRGTESKD